MISTHVRNSENRHKCAIIMITVHGMYNNVIMPGRNVVVIMVEIKLKSSLVLGILA